jgi:carboxypeptidase PM20D1
VALIGVAEKGYVTITINVKGDGGHSSMPPIQSALGQAAIIMQRLEDNQMKARLIPPVKSLLANIGGAMDFMTRMAIANQWIFKPLLIKSLSKSPSTNALIRTTTALTMTKGSEAENVLPANAEITVNFRPLPGDKIAEVKKHVEEACKGFEVDIQMSGEMEASQISSHETRGFEVMKVALSKIYPDALITPYLSVTGSDAPKYEKVSQNIYRLIPIRLTSEEQETIHNFNESLSIENYRRMIAYFREVMEKYD